MNFEDIPIEELKTAVALSYDGKNAPTIVASGRSQHAEDIIQTALANGIPLCDNPALVDLLSRVELGEEIPIDLYNAVAHVLAFAYEMSSHQ